MRYATKTTAECEAALGPRGHFHTTKDNRWTVRNWLTAQGLKSHFVNRLTYRELSWAYNDLTGINVETLRLKQDAGLVAVQPQPAEAEPVIARPLPAGLPLHQHIPTQPDAIDQAIADNEDVMQRAHTKANGGIPLPTQPSVSQVAEMLTRLLAQQTPTLDVDAVRKIVHEEVKGLAPRPVEIKVNGAAGVVIEERVHPVFDRVTKLVSQGLNVLLVGPAGCGKSHLCEQIARAFKADYGAIHGTAGASESALTGWLLPSDGGKFEYVPARFVELYEKGESLFCFDELDAFDPNMLLVVNGATANGHLHIAHRREMPSTKRGPNVRLMATANTYGTGANPMYSGRAALDGATLDRWVMVPVDYDKDLESDIGRAGGLSSGEMAELWALRTKVRDASLRRTISTRAFQKAAAMKAAGDSWNTIKATLVEGWSKDEKAKAGVAL